MKVYIEIEGTHYQIGEDMEREEADAIVRHLLSIGHQPDAIYAELSDCEQGSSGACFCQARQHLLGVD